MTTYRKRASLTALAAALCCALGSTATTQAVLPPRDCGTMEVRGKDWRVKADQVRCRRARRISRRYIRTRDAPAAYRCRRGPRGSSLFAQCTATSYAPDRVIYIIRRS